MRQKHIVIVGAGQLGSRHLQGLAKLDEPIAISVVDPNQDNLCVAESRFREVPSSQGKDVHFFTSLQSLADKDVDLAIVATNADIRAHVIRDMIKVLSVKNMVLEKILFQSIADYEDIEKILAQHAIKAWVNCPRRKVEIYRNVGELIAPGDTITMTVTGGQWGLGCNAIHFVDLFAYLIKSPVVEVEAAGLDAEVLPSKRASFVEFSGSLNVKGAHNSRMTVTSWRSSSLPVLISISSPSLSVNVYEGLGQARLAHEGSQWRWQDLSFQLPFQSDMTQHDAAHILAGREPGLTGFGESKALHLPVLAAFLQHPGLSKEVKSTGKCPIT